MRYFIGIPIKDWQDKLSKLLLKMKKGTKGVKWVKEENLHITLKFLGEIEEGKIEETKKIIEESLENIKSFSIEAGKLGAFPSLSSPHVIWLGIENGKEKVEEIFKNIEERLSSIDIPPDTRKFHPHITLGRVRRRVDKGWWKGILNMKLPKFPEIQIEEITLYSSKLHPDGPEYTPIKRYVIKK